MREMSVFRIDEHWEHGSCQPECDAYELRRARQPVSAPPRCCANLGQPRAVLFHVMKVMGRIGRNWRPADCGWSSNAIQFT